MEGQGFDQGKNCAVLARVVDELLRGRTLWDVKGNGISGGSLWMSYMSRGGIKGVGGRSSNSLSNVRRGLEGDIEMDSKGKGATREIRPGVFVPRICIFRQFSFTVVC